MYIIKLLHLVVSHFINKYMYNTTSTYLMYKGHPLSTCTCTIPQVHVHTSCTRAIHYQHVHVQYHKYIPHVQGPSFINMYMYNTTSTYLMYKGHPLSTCTCTIPQVHTSCTRAIHYQQVHVQYHKYIPHVQGPSIINMYMYNTTSTYLMYKGLHYQHVHVQYHKYIPHVQGPSIINMYMYNTTSTYLMYKGHPLSTCTCTIPQVHTSCTRAIHYQHVHVQYHKYIPHVQGPSIINMYMYNTTSTYLMYKGHPLSTSTCTIPQVHTSCTRAIHYQHVHVQYHKYIPHVQGPSIINMYMYNTTSTYLMYKGHPLSTCTCTIPQVHTSCTRAILYQHVHVQYHKYIPHVQGPSIINMYMYNTTSTYLMYKGHPLSRAYSIEL